MSNAKDPVAKQPSARSWEPPPDFKFDAETMDALKITLNVFQEKPRKNFHMVESYITVSNINTEGRLEEQRMTSKEWRTKTMLDHLEQRVTWELTRMRGDLSPKIDQNEALDSLAKSVANLNNQLRTLDVRTLVEVDRLYGGINNEEQGSRRRQALVTGLDMLEQVLPEPKDGRGRPPHNWTWLICEIATLLYIHGIDHTKSNVSEVLSIIFRAIGWTGHDRTAHAVSKAWPYVKDEIERIESNQDACFCDD